jgi:chromate transport protein ChrA
MIAAGRSQTRCDSARADVSATPRPQHFHWIDMANFLFGFVVNLALFVVVLFACHVYNRLTSGSLINGSHVFIALAFTALVLDAVLSLVVFADARNRYGQFSASAAFFDRACAYALAIVAASVWSHVARRARRARQTKLGAGKPLVIRTSPYSESHLRM